MRIGLYSEHLEEWYSVFSAEQILVLRLEDYSSDRLATLNRVYQHIGVRKSCLYYIVID